MSDLRPHRARMTLEHLEAREVLTATPTFGPEARWHGNFSFGNEVPLKGDFNGDGKDDLATFTRGRTGDVYVALSNGNGFVGTGWKWHNNFSFNGEIPLVGDFNGDGRDDIATFTRGNTGDVYVALSTGNGFVGTGWKWHNNFCFGTETPQVGDFNGDGRDDIATFTRGNTGDVYVALSNGSGFYGTGWKWHNAFCFGSETPLIGDFNGDNKDDIATFTRGATGDVYVALSAGTYFSGTGWKWHDAFCFGSEVPQIGDFNRDGKDDLATFTRGGTGDVYVALSTGWYFHGTGVKWNNSFCYGANTPLVGDFTGDGRSDLARFTKGGTGDVYVSRAMVQMGTNYVVLFSGGVNKDNNHVRYYDNIKAMYLTLVGECNVRPENVVILHADGTDSAIDRSDNVNSDMSYATSRGTSVQVASRTNLLNTLDAMKNKVDRTDHFFFYSFDHGSGSEKMTGTTGEEALNGWGSDIRDDELAPKLNAINGKYNSYVFTQCFAGGMIDDLGTLASNRWAAAATNHYEFSWGDGFARAFQQALANGWRYTNNVFNQAKANDPYAIKTAYADNGGTWTNQKEHPWDVGGSFPIFLPWHSALTSSYRPIWGTVVTGGITFATANAVGGQAAASLLADASKRTPLLKGTLDARVEQPAKVTLNSAVQQLAQALKSSVSVPTLTPLRDRLMHQLGAELARLDDVLGGGVSDLRRRLV